MLNLAMLRAVPWKMVGVGIMALTIAILFAALQMEKRHSDKLEYQIERLERALKRISDTKNKQAERTKQTIEQGRVIRREADRKAEVIETAPVKGDCSTPLSIMGGDL